MMSLGSADDTSMADAFSLLTSDERDLLSGDISSGVNVVEAMRLVAEPTFIRRVTVLARSAPLHAMDIKESWQQFTEDRYDLRGLALAAVDAVVMRQGLEDEATSQDVIDLLARLAYRAAPDLPSADHEAVARFVLKELLNDRNAGAKFLVHYSDYREGHQRVPLSFHLLEEAPGRRGQVVLRASVQAINALIGGLDLEVEDAQLAMDAVLRAQISRGQWGRAEESATKSMLLSVALAEKVRVLLAETEHDVRTVDWAERVPALLEAARSHLEDRLGAEDGLLDRMREARDNAGDDEVRATCLRIMALLDRCNQRHVELHGTVLDALRTFLDAQIDQRFRPIAQLRLVDLSDEILAPIVRMTAADAGDIAALFAEAVAGPVVRRLPRLAELYQLLLAPAREPLGIIPEDDEPEITDAADDAQPFSEAERGAARAVLSIALGRPRRLSELLHEAAAHGRTVADLVALSVVWAFAPEDDDDDDEIPMEFEDLFATRLLVLDDDTPLRHDGYSGADLLVVPVGSAGERGAV